MSNNPPPDPPNTDSIDNLIDDLGNGALWCLRSDNTINGKQLSKLKAEAKAAIQQEIQKQVVAELKKAHRANNTQDFDNATDEYIDNRIDELSEKGADHE